VIDFNDTRQAEQRLRDASNKLHALAPDVAHAKQVLDFAGDRRKNLLARYMAPLLLHSGVSAAETHARADAAYQAEFEALAEQSQAAEQVLAEWRATSATFDAARSLLSFSKETIRQLEG
jgi:hypothetical protein